MIWLVLVGPLLAGLLIPLRFELEIPERGSTYVRVSWMLGLVSRDLAAPAKRSARRPRAASRRRGRGSWIRRRLLAAIRSPRFPGTLARFGTRLLRATRRRELWIAAVVGLEDPCDTGMLWALVGPLSVAVSGVARGRVSLTPDFGGERLSVRGQGRFTVVPAEVRGAALGLLVTLLVIRRAPAPVLEATARHASGGFASRATPSA
jgi:hypothetical protein